jgi:hypothetical protein
MESNEFQVWANTGGDEAKGEWKFVLCRGRGIVTGVLRGTGHCTEDGRSLDSRGGDEANALPMILWSI